MVLASPSAFSTVAPAVDFSRVPCYELRSFEFKVFSSRFSAEWRSRRNCCSGRYVCFVFSNNKFHRKWISHACASSRGEDGGDSGARNPNFDSRIASLTRRGSKDIVIKRFANELDGNSGDYLPWEHFQLTSAGNFASFREDPLVDKLRTQLGVIHPLPSPFVNRNILGLFVFFFFVGVGFEKIWMRARRKRSERGALIRPQVPTNFSTFLEKDLQRKESVEWVNMVFGKLWKVYRGGLENWLVGMLQPVIDDLKKPDYVQRVEVKQFSLGDEPLSVRSVERRTSRRANDLQYQIGLRYTGGARMLLMLSLKFGFVPIAVPVGVRDFDIDGVLWVKLRLIPTEPWVGAVSWAFVALPKIKFELSPFRLFNIMAIPVLSMFLTKLLTEDLPRLFVRPKKIVLDFQKGKTVGPMTNDFKSGEINEKNKDYSGELSVTVVDACNLPYMLYGKTDPYVKLSLGDQTIRSKKNSRTTVIGSPGKPIWNQDFLMFVSNPRKQKLLVQVKDSLGFADVTIGAAEIDLGTLQDTVPTDRIAALKGGWGLLRKGNCGEVLLRLTYKAYVEDEEDDSTVRDSVDADVSEDEVSDSDEAFDSFQQIQSGSLKGTEANTESFMDDLAALIVSEEFQGIVASETGSPKLGDDRTSTVSGTARSPDRSAQPASSDTDSNNGVSNGLVLFWLSIVTGIAVLIAINISGSSFFNP